MAVTRLEALLITPHIPPQRFREALARGWIVPKFATCRCILTSRGYDFESKTKFVPHMEALQRAQLRLAPVKSSCTSFAFTPRQRPWLFRLPRSRAHSCAARSEHRRREILQAGVAIAGSSLLHVRASAASEMPLVPKADLAPGLSISQARCVPSCNLT